MFSSRQLFTKSVFSETLHDLEKEIQGSETPEKAKAIVTYLSFVIDKCINYNSRLSSWNSSRGVIRSVFDRHDFAFAWSFVEFNGAGNFLLWGVNQIVDAYREIAKLVYPSQQSFIQANAIAPVTRLSIQRGSAASLSHIPDASIDNITVDPPYYDNVQYAELSDFFYVWLKRSVGHLYPEFFRDELTNKDDEAVANPARFAALSGATAKSKGGKAKDLAEQDYENKMSAAFREMYRVLRPEGALTVMFTHKKVEAWDTLASALIGAGFSIKASWPVHTESEHSLHQAKKNAAASTILLVCRKREVSSNQPAPDGVTGPSVNSGKLITDHASLITGESIWWDDIKETVRRVAREKAAEFAAAGISGVDLYISTFGPALSVISEHWPVLTSEIDPKTGNPKALRPEIALDLAREEVIRLRKERLLTGNSSPKFAEFGGGREGVFTQYTDTMDYVRDQLREVYGSDVACYSGRGGEVWNSVLGVWVEASKETVKNDFREGKIRILVCTDSASEGLNLQTCGVLINYDMPWNPMRVEQRIGRVDRIGQTYPDIWISNYFYQDTIEDQIYTRLADRITWFETVVGELQPILAEIGGLTRQLAMTPAAERQQKLNDALSDLRQRIQQRQFASLNLDEFALQGDPPSTPDAPVTLALLEQTLTASNALAYRFRPHPDIEQAYLLDWNEQTWPVTFSGECFDRHPASLRLLTYGVPLLDELLQSTPAPDESDLGAIQRLESTGDLILRGWYAPNGNFAAEIRTLPELQAVLSREQSSHDISAQARYAFESQVGAAQERLEKVIAHRRKAQRMTELYKARRILLKAAMLEVAMGQKPEMFDSESYPMELNQQAIRGLARHRFPWAALVRLAGEPEIAIPENHEYFRQATRDTRESLKGKFDQLTQQARKAIEILGRFREQ